MLALHCLFTQQTQPISYVLPQRHPEFPGGSGGGPDDDAGVGPATTHERVCRGNTGGETVGGKRRPRTRQEGVVRADPLSKGLFSQEATDRVFSAIPTIISIPQQQPRYVHIKLQQARPLLQCITSLLQLPCIITLFYMSQQTQIMFSPPSRMPFSSRQRTSQPYKPYGQRQYSCPYYRTRGMDRGATRGHRGSQNRGGSSQPFRGCAMNSANTSNSTKKQPDDGGTSNAGQRQGGTNQ